MNDQRTDQYRSHRVAGNAQRHHRHERAADRRVGGGFRGDQADTWRRAAFDLVKQARPRAVVEHRTLAGAQAKHLLQEVDALAHRR